METGRVVAVCQSAGHTFSKGRADRIHLLAGLGVEGDAHCGATVKHRSRVAQNPDQPNLRQVHLIHTELFDEVKAAGFAVVPGQLGENITTRNVPLLDLPTGTRLCIGDEAVIELTGLRNPCAQIDQFQAGLLACVLDRREDGTLVRKAGVMAIVVNGGDVQAGDAVRIELPPAPHRPLERV